MKTAIFTIILAIAISFSSSVFAGGVDYVIDNSWCYADARDSMIQSAEVTLKEERGEKIEIQGAYVTDIIKVVNGPKRKEYNKVSFHVLTVDFDVVYGSSVTMIVYLIAIETDKNTYFSSASDIIDQSNEDEYMENLNEYITAAEKYMFLNEAIKNIK